MQGQERDSKTAAFESESAAMRSRMAALRLKSAALWLKFAALKADFDPNQPRVPRGSPRGGEWTRTGGGDGTRRGPRATADDGQVISDASPDNFWKPGSRVAQAGRGRAPRRVFINGEWQTPTPAQSSRLAVAEAQANAGLRRVREIDPEWRPRPVFESTIEGRIVRLRGEAREAEARLTELARRPPRELIDLYRAANNSRDLFGRETWPRDRGTVAVGSINRTPVFGINSKAPTYTSSDRTAAQRAVDKLVLRYPNVMKRGNLGERPNDALYHAEATFLLRAARANRGSLAGQRLHVNVDRRMCDSCEAVLPYLGRELGNPTVTFIQPNGWRRTMRDGFWID